jgi:hypothetical protein
MFALSLQTKSKLNFKPTKHVQKLIMAISLQPIIRLERAKEQIQSQTVPDKSRHIVQDADHPLQLNIWSKEIAQRVHL